MGVTSLLAKCATAVLLDSEVSAAHAIAQRAIPRAVGLVMAVEATGYTGEATARQAQVLPSWSVEKAKCMGANAVKLMVYYLLDASTAGEIENFISWLAASQVFPNNTSGLIHIVPH